MNSTQMFWRRAPPHVAALLVVLGLVAWLAPPPEPTDQAMMERVGRGVFVEGCSDLNCFRILVPAVLERLPGPSLSRWRAYAVLANAGAAVAAGGLAFALGCGLHAAVLTIWLSALAAGTMSTVYHPYNADPLVLFLAPVVTLLMLRGRMAFAGTLGALGIFAKEFAAAPLYIAAGAAALQHDWPVFRRRTLIALGVTGIWAGLQLGLMRALQYSYNENPSSMPMAGGYLVYWLRHVTPATGLFALFGSYGALYFLLPTGFRRAPKLLRDLAVAAIPAALAFVYVATPERALGNFFFLVIPMTAIVLALLPPLLAWAFVLLYATANLRIGAQILEVPSARWTLVGSIVIAIAALAVARRTTQPLATSFEGLIP